MKELSNFIEAIPQLQTAISFGAGFVVGALTKYKLNKKDWMPGGGAAAGFTIAAGSQGAMPNYFIDIGAALIGNYIGSKLVDKLMKEYSENQLSNSH